jgi:hypothetical protein
MSMNDPQPLGPLIRRVVGEVVIAVGKRDADAEPKDEEAHEQARCEKCDHAARASK